MTVPYIMESPNEGDRLEQKTDAAAAEEQLQHCGLHRGMSALDAGCGTGAVTRVISRIAAPARVVGIDQSSLRLKQARILSADTDLPIEFIEGDILAIPFPDRTFDFSWSRFLFQYLPRPADALAELCRVTRSGGTVAVADLDGQIEQFFPLPDALSAMLSESLELLAKTGFDPRVGRKLFHLFHTAGLHDIRIQVQPYQVYAGALPECDLENWRLKLTTTANYLIELTGERERFEHFRDEMLKHLTRPDTFYYCSLVIATGTV